MSILSTTRSDKGKKWLKFNSHQHYLFSPRKVKPSKGGGSICSTLTDEIKIYESLHNQK